MDPPNSSAPADTLPADNPLQPDTEQHSAAATAPNVSTLNNGDTTAGTSDETEFTSDYDILSSAGLFNVETTPAFKILEFMKTRRDVSQDEVAELKVRLQSLHSVLLDSFEAEKSSLKKLNNLNGEVSSQKLEMDKTQNRQFQENIEIGELKRELVKAENEHQLSIQREDALHAELEDLSKTSKELNSEIDMLRKHQLDILEPQLVAGIKELQLDVMQRRAQIENLQKDFDEKQDAVHALTTEKSTAEVTKEKHISLYSKASELPAKLQKQSEVFREGITLLAIEATKLASLLAQLDRDQEKMLKRKHEVEDLSLTLRAEFERRRMEMDQVEMESENIHKAHQLAKEQLFVQREEKVKLELAHKKALMDTKRANEALVKIRHEKESILKAHRRLETIIDNIKQQFPSIRNQKSDILVHLEMVKREGRFQKEKLNETKMEIDLSIHSYLQYEQIEKNDSEILMDATMANSNLERQLADCTSTYHDIVHQVDQLSMDRELKSRELLRMQSKLKRVHEESKLKSAALEDATKRYREVAVRSSEMSRLYDVLKLEKNKYMNQIQASKQRSLEMQEKIRILSGEVEILRTELAAKEKELSNQKLEALNAVSARDLMRQETNKHMLVYREHRDTVDQNASSLSVLQNTVESQERELILLKTQYEKTIEERNSRVSQLLERNDELCLLYERFNLQEKVLVKAEMEMQNRLDDIKQLQLEETDLTRHITLLRTTSTKTDDSRETVCALQEELEAIRMLETYLTTRAEDPFYKECEALLKTKREDDKKIIGAMNKLSVNMEAMLKKRAKNLPGKDPTAQDLAKRFNQLSAKLAQKEELLLEKELIINEVESLTTRLQDQVTQSREQSNTRNTEMSDLNYRIKSINRVMMSTVSELAMNQAQALRLEQERTEKQELLKFAEDNMAKGLAPSLEMQQAWEKAEMTRLKQSIERSNAKQELATLVDMLGIQPDDVQVAPESGVTESIFFSLPNGVRTTACPRPNAYISDAQKDTTLDGNPIHELPIPKPYGQFAPLKPSAMSVPMMRMARKQVAKEDPPSVATAEEYSTVVATSAYSIANFASMTPASMASVPMTPATPSGKTSATPNGNNALRFPSVSATAIV